MSTTNGHAKDLPPAAPAQSDSLPVVSPARVQWMSTKKIGEMVAELEVPFDPSAIEWRAVHTSKVGALSKGRTADLNR